MNRFLASSAMMAIIAGMSCSSTASACATTSLAETKTPTDEAASLEVIVVTAQRRSENAQSVPISLVAVGKETLEAAHIAAVTDLQRVVPGFSAQRAAQAANTRLSIRGVGSVGNSAIEPSVGAFVDGVYIARPGALLAGLNDVDGVEVLRGPQGTLFGRNASMGAISYHTALPADQFGATASLEGGGYHQMRANLLLNAPLTDAIALRVSGLYDSFDGYGDNVSTGETYGGQRLNSMRASLLTDLGPKARWVLRLDYQRMTGDGQAPTSVIASTVTAAARANFTARLKGQIPILDDTYTFDARQYTEGSLKDDQWGASSDLDVSLGEYHLRLLSAYRDWDNHQIERDVTNTPADLFSRDGRYDSRTQSHELQLTSPVDLLGGHLNYVSGLYYFRESYAIGGRTSLGSNYCADIVAYVAPARLAACRLAPSVGASTTDFHQITQSYAAYGQATYRVTPRLSVTGGLRYTHDAKSGALQSQVFNPGVIYQLADVANGLRFEGGKLTYRANVSFQARPQVMIFATVATGYKSGGFDPSTAATLGDNRVFQPETTNNYELGVKSLVLAGRVTANATLFRTDIDGFQLRSYDGTTFSVRNAGSLRQQGVEFELAARPATGVQLGLSAVRLDSAYTDFRNAPGLPGFGGVQDLTGKRAPNSPKWQGTLSSGYRGVLGHDQRLGWGINLNWTYQSTSDIGSGGDNNPQGQQKAYGLLSARLSLTGLNENWEVYLGGENLADQRYCTIIGSQALNAPLGLNDPVTGGTVQRCVLGAPRNVRLGAKLRY